VVLLTDRLWRARFNGDPAVIGSTIRLNRNHAGIAKYTNIGVLPASMRAAFANHADLWSPVARDDDQGANRRRGEFTVVARLKSGITMAQAEFALRAAADGLAREYPNTNRGLSVVLTDFQAHLTGTDRRSLLTLMGSVTFVLLIA
jgi:hypothetical protein